MSSVPYCEEKKGEKPGWPSCYGLGFVEGWAHPGNKCPSGQSEEFRRGWEEGAILFAEANAESIKYLATQDPPECDKEGWPPCYDVGFVGGWNHPGTKCPSGHSEEFCRGWEDGVKRYMEEGSSKPPTNRYIGNIICTPSTAMPGQSVLVEVCGPDGTPYNNKETFYIGINGVAGSRKYLQFLRPGKHTIYVEAKGPEGFEQKNTTIDILQLPGWVYCCSTSKPASPLEFPLLQVHHLPHTLYQVRFSTTTAVQNTATNRTSQSPSVQIVPHDTAAQEAAYDWDLGDGIKLATNVPYVEHDYERVLDPMKEYQHFDVTLSHAGKSVTRTFTIYNAYAHIKKLFGVISPPVYSDGLARKSGTRHDGGWAVTMTVNNPEASPLVLTQRRFVPISSDNNELTVPTSVEQLHSPINIPARSSLSLNVSVAFTVVPSDSAGFSVYYSGQSADGLPTRIAGHFDVDRQHHFTTGLRLGGSETIRSDPRINLVQNMLLQAIATNPLRQNSSVTLSNIRTAASQGRVNLDKFELARPIISNLNHVFSSPSSAAALGTHPIAVRLQNYFHIPFHLLDMVPAVPPPAEGNECDPDNRPNNVPDGFACQLTQETRWVTTKGRYMNARKGDLILAPGGNSYIGGLLRLLNQRYSHCGMMTSNHDQITHCTMAEDRMQDYPVGGGLLGGNQPQHGFRPDVVKYGWPGVITQTVENAVGEKFGVNGGEKFIDPENGKTYVISPFNQDPSGMDQAGEWQLIPPLVIKPDPMVETTDMRRQMHVIADDAVSQSNPSKYHYRFYCYTDPTIAQSQTYLAPADTGWAAGTLPAMCSGFIWLLMKKHRPEIPDVHLQTMGTTVQEGDLTPIEKEAGAMVGPATPDGLYLYTGADRSRAAAWLHDTVYNQVYNKVGQQSPLGLGWLVEGLTNVADNIANEIVNSFANDITQTDDSGIVIGYNLEDANSVSPDNLLFWADKKISFYSYAEQAIYREPRYEQVNIYRWKNVIPRGTLTGTVYFNNAPVPGVTIEVSGMTAFSDTNGKYQIQNVPYGGYTIKATAPVQGGKFLTNRKGTPIDIHGANTTCDIQLLPPPEDYRNIRVFVNALSTHYKQDLAFVNLRDDHAGPEHREFYFRLNNYPDEHGNYKYKQGEHEENQSAGDATSILWVGCDLQSDLSVKVNFTFTLNDTTAGLWARETMVAQQSNTFSVGAGGWQSWYANLSASNDDAHVTFTVYNETEQA